MAKTTPITIFFIVIAATSTLWTAPLRIMPLGDSITYDWRFTDLDDPRPTGLRTAYRDDLWYLLVQNGFDVDFVGSQVAGEDVEPPFDPDNEGHPGWTSEEIAEQTYAYIAQSQPDVVLLHIGTNDEGTSVDGVTAILDQIDAYEHDSGHPIKVFVALIIDTRNPTPKTAIFNQNLEAMLYRRIVAGDNLVIVDMYRQAGLGAEDYTDFYHPNDNGYAKMAYVWFVYLLDNPYSATDTLPTVTDVPIEDYPKTLVDASLVENQVVQGDTVTFETQIPDSGIVFK